MLVIQFSSGVPGVASVPIIIHNEHNKNLHDINNLLIKFAYALHTYNIVYFQFKDITN